ncbi:MAG: nitroreductase family protein [Coriobacteriales bacterium]|nr:nitroreductase family protein [Coriobacteriales bacterium]
MDFWDVVRSRHAVRDFTSDPIPREVLERIVEAAELAPSAMNSQPWRFYVATGETRLKLGRAIAQTTVHLSEYMDALGPERYEQAVKWYSSLGDAPAVVVVAMPRAEDEFTLLNEQLSVGAAIENLMLAATAEGLGSCNVTFSFWVRDDLADAVGAAENEDVVSIIALGYPGEVPPVAPPHDMTRVTYLD